MAIRKGRIMIRGVFTLALVGSLAAAATTTQAHARWDGSWVLGELSRPAFPYAYPGSRYYYGYGYPQYGYAADYYASPVVAVQASYPPPAAPVLLGRIQVFVPDPDAQIWVLWPSCVVWRLPVCGAPAVLPSRLVMAAIA